MADYPNHLNPFKRTGLRESFRLMKKSIGGHFRGKKDRPERSTSPTPTSLINGARLRQDGRTNGAVPRSETIIGATGTPEMLPRSRFTERVTRAKTMDFRANNHSNPFDDADKIEARQSANGTDRNGTPDVVVEAPAKVRVNGKIDAGNGSRTERHRRRKKRAPLPPGARATLNVPGEHSSSQWSIDSYTSYDTDYSSTTQAHSENEEVTVETAERLKDIQEISREIQGLCADQDPPGSDVQSVEYTNGENVEQDKDKVEVDNSLVQNEVQGEVCSKLTVEATNNEYIDKENISTEFKQTKIDEESNLEHPKNEVKTSDVEEENAPEVDPDKDQDKELKMTSPEEINNNIESITLEEESVKDNTIEKTTEIMILPTEDISQKFENKVVIDCDNLKESVPSKETSETESNNNVKLSEISDSRNDIDDNTKDVSYVDRRSIYIAGSAENLLDVHQTETTLYITGSCDQLDGTIAPTPKIRKHKLGREALLGSTDDGLNISSDKQ